MTDTPKTAAYWRNLLLPGLYDLKKGTNREGDIRVGELPTGGPQLVFESYTDERRKYVPLKEIVDAHEKGAIKQLMEQIGEYLFPPDKRTRSIAEAADALVALINASPRSPSREQIVAVLETMGEPPPLYVATRDDHGTSVTTALINGFRENAQKLLNAGEATGFPGFRRARPDAAEPLVGVAIETIFTGDYVSIRKDGAVSVHTMRPEPSAVILRDSDPPTVNVGGHNLRSSETLTLTFGSGRWMEVRPATCRCGRADTHFDTPECLGMTVEQFDAHQRVVLARDRDAREHGEALKMSAKWNQEWLLGAEGCPNGLGREHYFNTKDECINCGARRVHINSID